MSSSETLHTAPHANNAIAKFFKTRFLLHHKKPKLPPTEGSLSPTSSTDRGDVTSETSTLAPPSTLPPAVEGRDILAEAANIHIASEQHQRAAKKIGKLKWAVKQRSAFLQHVKDLQRSNSFIQAVVEMKALTAIHDLLVVPTFEGNIPDDILTVEDSLGRLHRALVASNHSSLTVKPLSLSVRILKPIDYLQMRKRLLVQHDYLKPRQGSNVYPLQFHEEKQTDSKMVLAETLTTSRIPPGLQLTTETDTNLPGMLCDLDPEVDESFRDIGCITTPGVSSDKHQLIQDISISWKLQTTVDEVIRSSKKQRTYVDLALRVAISYVYFTSLGISHPYPRLSDYRYYDPAHEDEKPLGPEHILMPYLAVGFGRKPPKKSTVDIGGSASLSMYQNEAMTRLGVLLHQIGCWTLIEEEDLPTAIHAAKVNRNELLLGAGMAYSQIVERCLESKEEDYEPQVQADRIYRHVVVALQKLVDELKWV